MGREASSLPSEAIAMTTLPGSFADYVSKLILGMPGLPRGSSFSGETIRKTDLKAS